MDELLNNIPAVSTPLRDYGLIEDDNGVMHDDLGVPQGQTWVNDLNTLSDPEVRGSINGLRVASLFKWWAGLIIHQNRSINEKMVLFWYHFIPVNFDDVRSMQNNSSTMCHDYMNLLRTNALGNFKDLIKAIAKMPAMLVFLSNQYSTASVPNENFARELMELFTLGKVPTQNYTESDIIAAQEYFQDGGYPVL